MKRAEEIKRLQEIIARDRISLENGAREMLDDGGRVRVEMMQCGACGESWNDALVTGRTPTPAGRCPYEHIHAEIKQLKRLQAAEKGNATMKKEKDYLVSATVKVFFRVRASSKKAAAEVIHGYGLGQYLDNESDGINDTLPDNAVMLNCEIARIAAGGEL